MNLEVIIKDIKSGEEILHEECDCIVGALGGEAWEGAVGVRSLYFTKGRVFTAISAIREAERAVENYKESLCKDFEKNCGVSTTFDELAGLVEKVTASIEADEDAIKAMKERAEQ